MPSTTSLPEIGAYVSVEVKRRVETAQKKTKIWYAISSNTNHGQKNQRKAEFRCASGSSTVTSFVEKGRRPLNEIAQRLGFSGRIFPLVQGTVLDGAHRNGGWEISETCNVAPRFSDRADLRKGRFWRTNGRPGKAAKRLGRRNMV